MNRWGSLALAMVSILGLAAFFSHEGVRGARSAAAASGTEDKVAGTALDSPFKPVAPLDVVMEKIDDIFAEFGPKLTEEGAKVTPKDLKKFKKDANFLSELFNVVRYHKKEKDFGEWASKNKDQFIEFAVGCDKGDLKVLKDAFERIDKTCGACHDKYRDKDK